MADASRRYLLDLHLAYHLAGSLIEHELASVGITAEEYAVYSVLVHEGGLTPTELSRRLGLAILLGVVACALELGIPRQFASMFTSDPAVIREAVKYLRIASVSPERSETRAAG